MAAAITIMATPPKALAVSEPRDEIRVTTIVITKTGKIAARIKGAMIRAPPVAGATPRPPRKPMNGERLWPTIAASAARMRGYVAAADRNHQEDGHRRLGHVEQAGNHRPAVADGARDVGAAGAAAADRPGIGPADQPGNDDPEWDAADQIAGDERDGDPDEVDGLHRREV